MELLLTIFIVYGGSGKLRDVPGDSGSALGRSARVCSGMHAEPKSPDRSGKNRQGQIPLGYAVKRSKSYGVRLEKVA